MSTATPKPPDITELAPLSPGDLPRSPESILGKVPGISVGKRGNFPNLPKFAQRRGTRRPPFAPGPRPAPVDVARQSPPAPRPAAPTRAGVPANAPGTEVPHELGQQGRTQPAQKRGALLHGVLAGNKEKREKVKAAAQAVTDRAAKPKVVRTDLGEDDPSLAGTVMAGMTEDEAKAAKAAREAAAAKKAQP